MLRPYTHRQMSKTIIAAQLDKQVFDEAQRLIEAGHFNSLDEVLEAALRTFVLKYAQGSPSLVARTVQAMMSRTPGSKFSSWARDRTPAGCWVCCRDTSARATTPPSS